MSFSTSKPVVSQLLPLTRANGSHVKGPAAVTMLKNSDLPPTTPQLKAKEQKLQLKETLSAVSRREMMALSGISLAGVSLLSPGPAEARTTRAEMKNKILEKLRELREKFGLPKEKEESGEQTSSPQKDNEVEEKKSTTEPENENGGTPTPQPQDEDGDKSPKQESKAGDETSTPQKTDESPGEQTSSPQKDNEFEEKKSTTEPENENGGTPTPQPQDEDGDKSLKQESKGGDETSTPQKTDESPFLPFFNLSEIEAEPLVEATLSQ